jgi:hypothetical protein
MERKPFDGDRHHATPPCQPDSVTLLNDGYRNSDWFDDGVTNLDFVFHEPSRPANERLLSDRRPPTDVAAKFDVSGRYHITRPQIPQSNGNVAKQTGPHSRRECGMVFAFEDNSIPAIEPATNQTELCFISQSVFTRNRAPLKGDLCGINLPHIGNFGGDPRFQASRE